MADSDTRPTVVTVAYALLIVGAVLLMAGGMLAASVSFDTLRQAAPGSVSDEAIHDYLRLYRGAGILFAVAGAGLALCARRVRDGDPRFRRAAVALGMAIIVVVGVVTVLLGGGASILVLISLLPIIGGTVILSRPAVAGWFARAGLPPTDQPADPRG